MTAWGPADLDTIGRLRMTISIEPSEFHDSTTRLRMRVDHADPVITTSAESLKAMERGDPYPATIPGVTLVDGVITFSGTNRTVIYRIDEYLPDQDAYVCRWPD